MNREKFLCCSYVHAFILMVFAISGAFGGAGLRAEPGPPGKPALEKKVDAVLKQMTLEEKIGLCSGTGGGSTMRGIPRLHIPDVQVTDGPRGPHAAGPTTAFPSGVLFGATWNPDLIQEAGQVMGNETRASGDGILLGPGINIQRDPLGGRFFEYYTEDPYLNGRLATAIVKGIQGEGVAACIKHYVCNNREDNRNNYMSLVDSRTLNEIYLPGFKAAVRDGHAWSVMTSANGVNGDFVSDSRALLNSTLKGQWGFDGLVMTDWLQTRSTEKAALAGLDVSMPGGVCGFAAPLLDAVKAGHVPEAVIDDKARRVLRVYARVGLLDKRPLAAGAVLNTPAHQRVARRVATEGIVLLKNSGRLLPLNPAHLKSVLVLGPSADKHFCVVGLGGSSWIQGPYEITPLAGIRHVLGDRVQYLATDDLGGFQPIPVDVMQAVNGTPGFQTKYFAQGSNDPMVQRVEPQVNFMWEMRSPDPKIPPAGFRAQFLGRVIPPATGTYTLRITAGGKAWLYVEQGGGAPVAVADTSEGRPSATAVVEMQKGKPFDLRVDYTRQPGDAAVNLTWEPPSAPQSWAAVDAAARKAGAVIVVGGIDHSLDSEGRDRVNMHFPPVQQTLINRVAQQNPKTVVVLINGSPLELGGWLPHTPAVVEAWYPGMEGGNAIADVLFGHVDPSGRLPFSWPKRLEDSPSHLLGTQNNDEADYKEKLMVGYRYYDTRNVEPQFPFGYGLSYTTFSCGPLHAVQTNGRVSINVTVKDTGARDGIETVQIYVRPLKPSVLRPVHELKAFGKISLKAGQSKRVDFQLNPEAFSYFNAAKNQWQVDPGPYEIQAGVSSRQILSTAKIVVRNKVPPEAGTTR
jgi:beta-glucosidase